MENVNNLLGCSALSLTTTLFDRFWYCIVYNKSESNFYNNRFGFNALGKKK